ncbi:hypothetical protein HRbin17_02665 [bacterium HR17]|uniref:Mechanosensitive ion channel MscS domain-containing protein n=1 Tax=Candidatus Fervidibacter japonicus TaxID=2035412 RepID=A0A2H5XG45_9BACT|nr:hypothetical protein HRbin17_02665 [bacterium HR17]
MVPTEVQVWLDGVVGWLRFWLLPRFGRALLIAFAAWLVARWMEGRWHAWLRPLIIAARDREPAEMLWRRVRLVTLPTTVTRILVSGVALWLIAEMFGVPRLAVLWAAATVTLSVLWAGRHLLADLAAGYSSLIDDTLMRGDYIELPFAEGVVERVTWLSVFLRLDDGSFVIVPHRVVRGTAVKIRRQRSTPNIATTAGG